MRRIITSWFLLCAVLCVAYQALPARGGSVQLLGAGRTGGSAAWVPTSSIGPLQVWFKADAGVTGTSPVTAWADQSGNGRNVTSASGVPALTTGVQNGLPGILSSSGNGTNLATGTFTLAQPFMVFTAVKTNSSLVVPTNTDIFDDASQAGSRALVFLQQSSTSAPLLYAGTLVTSTGPIAAINTPYYVTGILTNGGGTDKVRVNGADAAGASGSSAGTSGITNGICVGACSGSALDGYVIEQFVISGTSATDLANAENYLKTRMGL